MAELRRKNKNMEWTFLQLVSLTLFKVKETSVSWHWQRLVIPAEMAFNTGRAGAGRGREGMERNEG